MNNEELKPCPFCGGEAEFVQVTKNVYVRCRKCGALAGDVSFKEKVAIAAWNRRDYLTEEIQATLRKLDYYEEEAGGASVAYLLAENRDLRKALVALKNAKVNYLKKQDSSKLSYKELEKMVKPLEWELECENGDSVAKVGKALFRISYWDNEAKYIVFCNTTIIKGGFTLLDEAKHTAQEFLVDLVADALGVERSGK